ncbi:MAG: hypothetical protein Q4E59_03405 [Bacteroidales bacterium]|nr:hypothetical protein [Bacteroidales bacterium]
MKRTSTFLLSLLLGLGGVTTASAQALIPAASDDTNEYVYYVKCAGSNNGYFLSKNNYYGSGYALTYYEEAEAGDSLCMESASTASSTCLIVKLVASDTGDGSYNIYTTNLTTNLQIGYNTETPSSGAYIGYYEEGQATYGDWFIQYNVTENTINGYTPYYNVVASGATRLSWNRYTSGNNAVRLYSIDHTDSHWNFIPANLATLQKACDDIEAAIETIIPPYGFTFSSDLTALQSAITTARDNDYSYENAIALLDAYGDYLTDYIFDSTILTDGYYKIVSKATSRYEYLFNDDFYSSNTSKYTLLSNTEVTTNNGIWKLTFTTNSDDETIMDVAVLNGQGTGVRTTSNYHTTLNIDLDDAASTADGYFYFTQGINCTNSGYVGDYLRIVNWTAGGASKSDNRWQLVKVDVSNENVYTVTASGLDDATASSAYVTYTHDDVTENAYAGGFFISSSTPTVDNMTASSVAGYDVENITVSDNEIVVTYTQSSASLYAAIQEVITSAEALLAYDGVGYPTDAERETLQAAISEARGYDDTNATTTALTAIQTAYNTYYTTTEVKMPEDGKAYTFTFQTMAGTEYLLYNNAGTYATMDASTASESDILSATLICRVIDADAGTFAFVNNSGNFLVLINSSSDGYDDNDGNAAEYASTYCDLTLAKLVSGMNTYTASGYDDELFGCFYVRGKRSGGDTRTFIISSSGSFNTSGSPYFNSSYTSAIFIEEVSYPNTVTLNSTEGMNDATMSDAGVNYIGTFSAPFATVLPDGVSAYYVSAAADGVATVTALGTGAVPANTGVLLTSADQTSALMVPVTNESVAAMGTNLLGNSAGADLAIESNSDKYILTKNADGKIAFYLSGAGTLSMNKAYLDLSSSTSSANSLVLNFGGTATSIEGVEATEAETDKVIYDLSGRSVKNAQKGLYIVNGKKVIVK